jgi:hypothetical protein
VRFRQPEKILFPPELPVLLVEPIELGSLHTGEQALVTGASLTAIDAGLPHPASEAAGRETKPLGKDIAGETLLQAQLNGLRFLLRREPTTGTRGGVIDGQSGGHGVTLTDLSVKTGKPHLHPAAEGISLHGGDHGSPPQACAQLEALGMALRSGRRPQIFHSDQGCQFTSAEFVAMLQREGIQISWSGRKR